MKRIAMFLMAAAMVATVSCEKDPQNGKKQEEGNKEEQKNLELKIEIDGDFSDWVNTDASIYAAAENDPDSPWDGVEEIRCCADKEYVYYYIRYNQDVLEELLSLKDELPIRLNINTDGEFDSGYQSYSLQGYDFIIEGDLGDAAGNFGTFDGVLWQRIGSWVTLLEKGNGLSTGMGKGNEYEIMVDRGLFGGAVASSSDPNSSFGDVFQTGIRFYETTVKNPGHWEELSNMPNSSVDDGGLADLLEVTTFKGK